MAKLPDPRSYEQILGEMYATYFSKIGINDVNTGSAVSSFFEAMAQAIYRASGDTFAILRDFSVDRAEGEALKRIAEEENITVEPARVATGKVTVDDTSFNKISTKVYAGTPPPNIGSTSINVSDASEFSASGAIFIGRGTANVEGPISYGSITPIGGFFTINLSTPTVKYHNISESVILSQGGTRNITAGEVIRTESSGASPAIVFSTTKASVILDGEDEIVNVPITAQEPGTEGNVPRNSIKEFISPPFSGASVTNPNPLTTGKNDDTDEEIRNKIKKFRISKGLGTAIAIKSAVLGVRAEDENATVTSNEIFSDSEETVLFIDNGEGYEEKTEGVGLEFIVDSALGGERLFQLVTGGKQSSVVKAFLESSNISPYSINPTDRLAILVGSILSEHVFIEGDFRSNGFATAFEIVASINGNANLSFSARTIDNGTKVTISSKEEENEFLQRTTPTVGNDAGTALGLSTNEVETLKIYKNNQPLSRNGRSAIVESENQVDWSNTITNGDTLIIVVDRTAAITYIFIDDDFAAEGTHSTVSQSNTLQSWVNVINAKITGITASINGNRIVFTSNLGANSRASISITNTSTLVSKGMFTETKGLSATGLESDFTLSRNTAQFKLTSPLEAGDSLTSGSEFTQGTVSTSQILGGIVTITDQADLWFIVDNNLASIISHGVVSDSIIHFTKEAGNTIKFRSNLTNAFGNVQVGDYIIIWTEDLLPGNRIEGRVSRVGTDLVINDLIEIRLTATEFAATSAQTPITFSEGLVFVRSDVPPQKVSIAAGSLDINAIATDLTNQILGVSTSTENDEIINLSTNNKSDDGGILTVTFNIPAKNFNFIEGASGSSTFSHFGFLNNSASATKFPLFVHNLMTADRSADPPTSFIADFESAVDLSTLDINPNVLVCMQNSYLFGGLFIEDAQAYDECVQIDEILGTTVDIDNSKTIRRIRTADRYYLLNPLDFDFNDDITVVFDNNAVDKTFPINLFRRAITNTTQPINANEFRAFDVDAGATTEFEQFFTSSYSFKNYKVLMRARNVIDPTSATDEDAILYRSAQYGEAGERYNIGYIYPTSANQAISGSVIINSAVKIRISLKSGTAIVNNIDGTTEWDITITPNTPVPGVDEVTYTHNGTGTAPAIGTLAPGDYVTINSNGDFDPANTGTFRVSSATATSFTVRRPNGIAVAELGVATLTTNTISLYEDDDTTAQEIVDFVTANLTNWTEAEIVDDNGSTGAGIINLSTHEDNDFGVGLDSVTLLDGLNWIKSSDLGASAPDSQFIFKITLSLPSFSTNTANAYAFNNGEEVRIIPTTVEQLNDFFNVLAVTGLTTIGDLSLTQRERDLQLFTQILGSGGAIKVSGGNGNISQALIVSNSTKIPDTDLIKVNINVASANGINVGSWLKLVADAVQKKDTGISFTTKVTITPNVPTPTTSIIELSNRDTTDRYFGQPRNNFKDRNRAFHIEKHGSLVNISWDGITGSDPIFSKIVEFNDAVGGNMLVNFNGDFLTTEYTVTSGTRNFSEVGIGDTAVVQNFADSENNGTFIVKGISDDGLTLSLDNPTGISDSSTAVSAGDIIISTEIEEGDSIEINAPFTSLNRGLFKVIRKYENSIYIENDSAIEERIIVSDNLRSLGFDGTTGFDVTVSGDMRIDWDTNGTTPSLENAKMGDSLTIGIGFAAVNQGTFMVTGSGDNFITVANSKAIAEVGVVVSGVGANVLESQIPAILFSSYENTRVGDSFVISGNVLGVNNIGTHVISEILSKTKVVVNTILVTQVNVQLNDLFIEVFVQEGTAYIGYKKVFSKAVDPANTQLICLLFDTNNQFDKITEIGSVTMTAQSKLGFITENTLGFDSYRFHTGLIRQSNKVVYGDPRDSITFPGVAAAGAEIFIQPPLVRKIEISINVRVQTGIPFSRITEQVRNNIAALINSSPIGESIAISDIIASVNSIPGTKAISISSPTYDPQNDVIKVNPAEKPFIIDIVNDITVSKVE